MFTGWAPDDVSGIHRRPESVRRGGLTANFSGVNWVLGSISGRRGDRTMSTKAECGGQRIFFHHKAEIGQFEGRADDVFGIHNTQCRCVVFL